MARIAFINEKGGTLKTTIAVHMAAYSAAFLGRKTLLIDADPQGNAGKTLGIVDTAGRPSISEVLLGKATIAESVIPTSIDGLDVIVADKRLADTSLEVSRMKNPYGRLRDQIADTKGYGHVLFDSPPSVGVLTRNILAAAAEVIVPVSLTYLAIDGCAEIVRTIEQSRKDLENPGLRLRAVAPTLYRNTRLANEILDVLRKQFGARCARTVIGFAVHVDEAQSHGQTVWQYAPHSRASEMFFALARELLGEPKRDGFAALKSKG